MLGAVAIARRLPDSTARATVLASAQDFLLELLMYSTMIDRSLRIAGALEQVLLL